MNLSSTIIRPPRLPHNIQRNFLFLTKTVKTKMLFSQLTHWYLLLLTLLFKSKHNKHKQANKQSGEQVPVLANFRGRTALEEFRNYFSPIRN